MARELFIPKPFTHAHSAVIRKANEIISEYSVALTLRQLYYQFVSRDIIPNTEQSYKRLGGIISDARLAGRIDWRAIADNTRAMSTYTTHISTRAAMDYSAKYYLEDPWLKQPYKIFPMIEKDALVGVITPVCWKYRMPHFACRGYVSQSEQYEMGKRIARWVRKGFKVLVLHLGDHDPSGIDMTRDNEERIRMFGEIGYDDDFEFRRIALNMDQIEQYSPPPNPAKTTDSRFRGYTETYGTDSSWELDALSPRTIDEIISGHVAPLIDDKAWAKSMKREKANRALLHDAAERWPKLLRELALMKRKEAEDDE